MNLNILPLYYMWTLILHFNSHYYPSEYLDWFIPPINRWVLLWGWWFDTESSVVICFKMGIKVVFQCKYILTFEKTLQKKSQKPLLLSSSSPCVWTVGGCARSKPFSRSLNTVEILIQVDAQTVISNWLEMKWRKVSHWSWLPRITRRLKPPLMVL